MDKEEIAKEVGREAQADGHPRNGGVRQFSIAEHGPDGEYAGSSGRVVAHGQPTRLRGQGTRREQQGEEQRGLHSRGPTRTKKFTGRSAPDRGTAQYAPMPPTRMPIPASALKSSLPPVRPARASGSVQARPASKKATQRTELVKFAPMPMRSPRRRASGKVA